MGKNPQHIKAASPEAQRRDSGDLSGDESVALVTILEEVGQVAAEAALEESTRAASERDMSP